MKISARLFTQPSQFYERIYPRVTNEFEINDVFLAANFHNSHIKRPRHHLLRQIKHDIGLALLI